MNPTASRQALAAGKLVRPALLAKAYTQVILPDGRATRYGFGWELGTVGSHATIEHAGGIPGFSADELQSNRSADPISAPTN